MWNMTLEIWVVGDSVVAYLPKKSKHNENFNENKNNKFGIKIKHNYHQNTQWQPLSAI